MAAAPTTTKEEIRDVESKVEEEEEEEELDKHNKAVADIYDTTSKIISEIAGEHFHVGFYDSTSNSDSNSSTVKGSAVYSAQIRMIEEALRFACISDDPLKKPKNVLDVGCGIGGSSRYLACKYGAQCTGITLSPFEVVKARSITAAQGLKSQISFQLADALHQPFPDGEFDLIWCVECADHMTEKAKFIHELARVAAPGATIILLTWCHREELHPDERRLLEEGYKASHGQWCSITDYVNLMESCSLQDIKFADWSQYVAPHYAQLRKLTFSLKGVTCFIRHSGWKHLNIKMLRMPSVFDKYKNGVIMYCVLTCKKPE